MKRLSFRLPEFAPRTTWASTLARETWEPRIRRISQCWEAIERQLVVEGLRPSALQNITPEQLPALMAELAPQGVIVLPLAKHARAKGYTSAAQPLLDGEAWDYRCAITRPEHAAAWASAWATSDNDSIGRLLGYPDCCRPFFGRVWVGERWMDTTWRQAEGTEGAQRLNSATVEGISIEPAGAVNALWRWLGLRTVSHLPCSFTCQASAAQGEAALQLMAKHFPEEAAWLRDILSWPVEWSALHGIAEIRTPIHRTSAATDATATKLVVRYKGTGYPAEGAQGTGFPHRAAVPKPANVLRMSNPSDNGFTSRAAMNEAHSKLLALTSGPYRTVIDLGSGDGELLSKIPAARRVGMELNPAVAKRSESRLDRVVVGDCARPLALLAEEQPDLVIAQRDRNPPATLAGYRVLSYSYEPGADAPQLVDVDDAVLRRQRA